MTSVSAIALGGLQVVALLLPVVIATTRFLVPQLEPTEDQLRKRRQKFEWLQTWIVFGGLGAIVLLSICAVLFVGALIVNYNLPVTLLFGFLLLLAAILAFAFPIMLVVSDQRKRGNIPSLEPPR
ncbi:hypothetical protein ACOJIV_28215 [Haloarcula sp. AONF1]|jgi:amino acid transporter